MRRVYSLILMVALLVTASVISGCFPPNYSKEQAKKIVSEHKHEALAWFSKNMPAAKPDSDCEAYATELNLLGAIKGSYKVNGKSYDYVFDYNTKSMYVGEGYEEACALVKAAILKEFNYSAKETKVNFHGYSIKLKNENDKPSNPIRMDRRRFLPIMFRFITIQSPRCPWDGRWSQWSTLFRFSPGSPGQPWRSGRCCG